MELVRNWQGTRVILLVRQFQASLDAVFLCSKIWPKLWNNAGRYCALLHRSRDTVPTPEHPPSYNILVSFGWHYDEDNSSRFLVTRFQDPFWHYSCVIEVVKYLHSSISSPHMPVHVCLFHVRSWRCDMYYCGWPIYTIPEYILVGGQSSYIILYKDSEEGYPG